MSATRDGGYAFPNPGVEYAHDPDKPHETHHESGMSLRDWFAGQALTGLLGKSAMTNWTTSDGKRLDGALQFAACAYGIADAMLIERAKP